MDNIIGYCGLLCTECPAYLATQMNDDELRRETAEKWSVLYDSDIKPESINCDGCTTEGAKFHHCSQCEIRACGLARGVKNCGHCDEYPCAKIEEFFGYVPGAKTVLDAEKASR